jgi:hypothetical protein
MHQLSILIKNPLIVIIHNILPLKHCQNNPYPPGVPKKYVAMMPPALPVSPEHLNTIVNPKESSQICSHGPSCTAYPGTHFGFSSMVKGFGDRPKRGLRAVPGNRLLLESDSPHLPDVAGSINHPAHLFRVAEEVAQVRGQSPLDILRAGIANGQALYRRK